MQRIEWTSEFALGIDEIDAQHCALVGMINELSIGRPGDDERKMTGKLLLRLADYVRDHFAQEEHLMAAGRCASEHVSRHCVEHAYFRSVLKDLTHDFENGRRSITAALTEHLVHWLLHHIAVIDRAMAHELKAAERESTEHRTEPCTELHTESRAVDTIATLAQTASGAMSANADTDSARLRVPGQRGVMEPASESNAPALILFAHGARDPEWASPMRRVRAAVQAQSPGLRVELAFLEFIAPTLRDCAESLLAEGCGRIVVLPMFIAQGGHLKNDVPLLLEELRQLHPQARFELAGAVGEADSVVQAMAAHVLALAGK